MDVRLRPGTPQDAGAAGRICYEAFRSIAEAHGFRPDFPSTEVTGGMLGSFLAHPLFYSVAAELDGEVAGSNFLDERVVIAAVGPITVAPNVQDRQIGRALWRMSCAGRPTGALRGSGCSRRPTTAVPWPFMPSSASGPGRRWRACRVARSGPRSRATGCVPPGPRTSPIATPCAGTSTATTAPSSLPKRSNGARPGSSSTPAASRDTRRVPPSLRTPSAGPTGNSRPSSGHRRHSRDPVSSFPSATRSCFTWCLSHGLRVTQLMTLMTIGLYNEPVGAWMPSIEF
jgi:hypothetical protein